MSEFDIPRITADLIQLLGEELDRFYKEFDEGVLGPALRKEICKKDNGTRNDTRRILNTCIEDIHGVFCRVFPDETIERVIEKYFSQKNLPKTCINQCIDEIYITFYDRMDEYLCNAAATNEFIMSFSQIVLHELDEKEMCPVCFGDSVTRTECMHVLCTKCAEKMRAHELFACPICRTDL